MIKPIINSVPDDLTNEEFVQLLAHNTVSLDIIQKYLNEKNAITVLCYQNIDSYFIELNSDVFLNNGFDNHIAAFGNLSLDFILKYSDNLKLSLMKVNDNIDSEIISKLEIFK